MKTYIHYFVALGLSLQFLTPLNAETARKKEMKQTQQQVAEKYFYIKSIDKFTKKVLKLIESDCRLILRDNELSSEDELALKEKVMKKYATYFETAKKIIRYSNNEDSFDSKVKALADRITYEFFESPYKDVAEKFKRIDSQGNKLRQIIVVNILEELLSQEMKESKWVSAAKTGGKVVGGAALVFLLCKNEKGKALFNFLLLPSKKTVETV